MTLTVCMLVMACAVANAELVISLPDVDRQEGKSNQFVRGAMNKTGSCVSTGKNLKRCAKIADCGADRKVVEVRVVNGGCDWLMDVMQVVGTIVPLLGIVCAAFYQRRAQKISLFEKRNLCLHFWNAVGKCLKLAQDDSVKEGGDGMFNAISFVMRFVEELKRSKDICGWINKDEWHVIQEGHVDARFVLEKVKEELLKADSVFSSRKISFVKPVIEALVCQIKGNAPEDGVVIPHAWIENEAQFYERISETLNDMQDVSEEMQKEMSLTKKWYELG